MVLPFLLLLPSSSPEGLAVVWNTSWTGTTPGLPPAMNKRSEAVVEEGGITSFKLGDVATVLRSRAGVDLVLGQNMAN